jgi:hypothetical protein
MRSERFGRLLESFPSIRIGQFIQNLFPAGTPTHDLYYISDHQLLKELESYYFDNVPPGRKPPKKFADLGSITIELLLKAIKDEPEFRRFLVQACLKEEGENFIKDIIDPQIKSTIRDVKDLLKGIF